MAIPTVASVGAVSGGTGDRTVAPGATHTTNDIDIMIVETANDASTLATANGFAELLATTGQGTAGNTDATRLTVFWRRWDGAAGSPVVEGSAANHTIGRMISITGCITTGDPWDGTPQENQQTTATTAGSATGYTTTVDDCLVLICTAGDLPDANSTNEFTGETNAGLSSLTERMDDTRNAGNGGAIGMWSGGLASLGAIGTTTFTSVETSLKDNAVIALKPPVAGGVDELAGSSVTVGFGPTMFKPGVNR